MLTPFIRESPKIRLGTMKLVSSPPRPPRQIKPIPATIGFARFLRNGSEKTFQPLWIKASPMTCRITSPISETRNSKKISMSTLQ